MSRCSCVSGPCTGTEPRTAHAGPHCSSGRCDRLQRHAYLWVCLWRPSSACRAVRWPSVMHGRSHPHSWRARVCVSMSSCLSFVCVPVRGLSLFASPCHRRVAAAATLQMGLPIERTSRRCVGQRRQRRAVVTCAGARQRLPAVCHAAARHLPAAALGVGAAPRRARGFAIQPVRRWSRGVVAAAPAADALAACRRRDSRDSLGAWLACVHRRVHVPVPTPCPHPTVCDSGV
jgi:hypothetical protein